MKLLTTTILYTASLFNIIHTTTALSNPHLLIDPNFSSPFLIFNNVSLALTPPPSSNQDLLSEELEDIHLDARQLNNAPITSSLAATQYPTTTVGGSLFVLDGTTTATWQLFTQTFAATALGSWELGPTPRVGTIGLGSIAGTVGGIKTKRDVRGGVLEAVQTAGPRI